MKEIIRNIRYFVTFKLSQIIAFEKTEYFNLILDIF